MVAQIALEVVEQVLEMEEASVVVEVDVGASWQIREEAAKAARWEAAAAEGYQAAEAATVVEVPLAEAPLAVSLVVASPNGTPVDDMRRHDTEQTSTALR